MSEILSDDEMKRGLQTWRPPQPDKAQSELPAPSGWSGRGIVCCFCGEAWGYAGQEPPAELLKEAVEHEKGCNKNPYTIAMREALMHLETNSMADSDAARILRSALPNTKGQT